MKIFTLQNISQGVFISMAFGLVWFIVLSNIAPFGATAKYSSRDNSDNISELAPANRFEEIKENGETVARQKEDLVYFTTKMPFPFESAKIKIIYKNPHFDQDVHVGFQDEDRWHYATKVLDLPFLNSLEWTKTDKPKQTDEDIKQGKPEGPILYQKNKKFDSTEEFLQKPPKNSLIGIFAYEAEFLNNSFDKIPDYTPSTSETIISSPIRGSHNIYAYVDNEPFKMSFVKQDLNWYQGEDVVNIRIYKEKDLVYSADIQDDGIIDNSKKTMPGQEVVIQNPGPGLPESGTYKVVVDAGGDVVFKEIKTNLHKIVFANHIFLAENKDVYPTVINETRPTKLYTNAVGVSGQTYHSQGFQKIIIGDASIDLKDTKFHTATASADTVIEINVPKNDVVLKGELGYFAFSPVQLYNPTPYFISQVSNPTDLEIIDYLLTSYDVSKRNLEGEWQTAEIDFDLKKAVIKDGKLSWLIKAPGLKENNRSFLIKDIEVEFRKEPVKDILPRI